MEIGNILRVSYRLWEKWNIAFRSWTINARLMKLVMGRNRNAKNAETRFAD